MTPVAQRASSFLRPCFCPLPRRTGAGWGDGRRSCIQALPVTSSSNSSETLPALLHEPGKRQSDARRAARRAATTPAPSVHPDQRPQRWLAADSPKESNVTTMVSNSAAWCSR